MIRKLKVLLVDDHPLVREWLTSLIDQQPDMGVCGEAGGIPDAVKALKATSPDIVVVDLSLKDASGLELIKTIKARWPQMGIVVLSMHDEEIYAERCIRAGARGYVMKRESTKRIIAAIRDVHEGRLCVSDQIATSFAEKFIGGRAGGQSSLQELSDRELEVFDLLGRGMGTRQIAESLNVSIKTVQAYCARIKQKLHLATATELLREAIRWHDKQSEGAGVA
ncbi:MAG TPA: response regulator transcription factor [Rhizomicrobium sp.]|nr:response regulator transcription factor [Rhizomicrobium sp.]